MPTEKISMRKIREVLRLTFEAGLNQHQVAASVRLSQGAGLGGDSFPFVDYCGPTVAIIETYTGEVRLAQIFVAVLGALFGDN